MAKILYLYNPEHGFVANINSPVYTQVWHSDANPKYMHLVISPDNWVNTCMPFGFSDLMVKCQEVIKVFGPLYGVLIEDDKWDGVTIEVPDDWASYLKPLGDDLFWSSSFEDFISGIDFLYSW